MSNSLKAHEKFFVPKNTESFGIALFPIFILFWSGVFILYKETKNIEGETFVAIMIGAGLIISSFLLLFVLVILMLHSKHNLKGVPLEIESDLACNVHYNILSIFTNEANKRLCRIGVVYPHINSFNPVIESVYLENKAKAHDLELKKGLIFGKKKDGTIFFVQPKKEDDSPKNLSDAFG